MERGQTGMTDAIIIAVLSLLGTCIGSIAGIMTANRLVNYRIESLEKKMDKHNGILERFVILERDEETQWKRIDEMRSDIEKLKEEARHV